MIMEHFRHSTLQQEYKANSRALERWNMNVKDINHSITQIYNNRLVMQLSQQILQA